jgi:hypothetical protein
MELLFKINFRQGLKKQDVKTENLHLIIIPFILNGLYTKAKT